MTLADARIKEVIATAPRQAAGGPNVHVAELRDVSLSFDDKLVLDQVSLAVDPQERLVIIGQSGSGKTTILRLILGILTPTAGTVFFQRAEYFAPGAAGSAKRPHAHRHGLPGRGFAQLHHGSREPRAALAGAYHQESRLKSTDWQRKS